MNPSGLGATAVIRCDRCQRDFGKEFLNQPELIPCPGCSSSVQIITFPALARGAVTAQDDGKVELGEAGCFFHPEKKASVVCDSCGRFLCSLCDLEIDGKQLCPSCVYNSSSKGKIQTLEVQRTRHDRIALTMALGSTLVTVLSVFVAPVTIYYAIRHWKSPGGLTSGNPRIGLSIAIAIAILQLVVFGLLLITILATR